MCNDQPALHGGMHIQMDELWTPSICFRAKHICLSAPVEAAAPILLRYPLGTLPVTRLKALLNALMDV